MKEDELSLQDVLAFIIPLAAEEITRDEVWDKFADIILSNEHKIPNLVGGWCCQWRCACAGLQDHILGGTYRDSN